MQVYPTESMLIPLEQRAKVYVSHPIETPDDRDLFETLLAELEDLPITCVAPTLYNAVRLLSSSDSGCKEAMLECCHVLQECDICLLFIPGSRVSPSQITELQVASVTGVEVLFVSTADPLWAKHLSMLLRRKDYTG